MWLMCCATSRDNLSPFTSVRRCFSRVRLILLLFRNCLCPYAIICSSPISYVSPSTARSGSLVCIPSQEGQGKAYTRSTLCAYLLDVVDPVLFPQLGHVLPIQLSRDMIYAQSIRSSTMSIMANIARENVRKIHLYSRQHANKKVGR